MSVIAEEPRPSFRIDMLWTDSRYRSGFLQAMAMILVISAAFWLVSNVISNLAILGKTFGFSYLTQPASYDINQRLIEYTSRSTHSTAAVVGMLNTLLVAVLGCITATVIGVVAGVLRLSKNWLVRGIVTVYIEVVRNVPVLIQILLFAAIFDGALPRPNAAEPALGGLFVATNRGFYFPTLVFEPGSVLVVAAFIAGVVGAIAFGRWAKARQEATGEILPVFWIKLALIAFATLAAYLAAGRPIGVEYPELRGFNWQGGIFARNSLMALWLALSIYTGAFIAENVRGGIQAVSKGQTEAAFALGLRPNNTMSLVVLPQALRVIIPPLISQFLNLTKNSSLAIAIGYMDVAATLGRITLNQTGKEMESLLLLMAFYLAVSLAISAVMNLYNEQVKLVERTSAGFGLGVADLFSGINGKWLRLKKGDAQMRPGYGIGGFLNLVWLFYLGWLALLLDNLFLAEITEARPSYFVWGLGQQIAVLAMVLFAFAALITCVFKNARFVDLAALEAAVFIMAVLLGFAFGQLLPGIDGPTVVFVGLAARLAILGYTVFGARPNLTYLNRVRGA